MPISKLYSESLDITVFVRVFNTPSGGFKHEWFKYLVFFMPSNVQNSTDILLRICPIIKTWNILLTAKCFILILDLCLFKW